MKIFNYWKVLSIIKNNGKRWKPFLASQFFVLSLEGKREGLKERRNVLEIVSLQLATVVAGSNAVRIASSKSFPFFSIDLNRLRLAADWNSTMAESLVSYWIVDWTILDWLIVAESVKWKGTVGGVHVVFTWCAAKKMAA